MLKWGVVGTDLIGEDFIKTLIQSDRKCSVAQCTDDQIKGRFPKVTFYDTVDEMLEKDDIAILYISTYANQHDSIIKKALQQGCHVIGEKPLFMNNEDAKEAYAMAVSHHLLLGEANTLFYMPVYHKVKEEIKHGRIGKLKMVRAEFGSLKEEDKASAVLRYELGGGALYDIGIYALSAVLMFLEGEVEIAALNVQHPYGVDEGWSILLKDKKGHLASIQLSIRCKLDKRLLIAGDQGFIEIMNYPRAASYDMVSPDMTHTTYTVGDSEHALCYEIEQVESMIKQGDYDAAMLPFTCRVMELMDQIRREIKR